ncbi:MAG TPA: vitamin K epoxide reductase family protein [Pyrinomonadaceae bacterium]
MSARNSKTLSEVPVKEVSATHTSRGLYFYGAVALLSLIGLGDAIYLTVKHVTGGIVPCTLSGGCEQVLNSSYATIGGIPLALLGALAYFTVFSLAILAAFGNKPAGTLLFYQVLLMLAVSIWLFILQAFVIHAYCQFCLLSAAITLLLFLIVAAQRLLPKFRRK